MKGLPERLVEIRTKHGYSRKELADTLNIPYRTLTNYENGEREPGHSFVITIAQFFNVSTDYILGVEPKIKKAPVTEEPVTGDHISLEESTNLLAALGFIAEGQDLSDDDLAFLGHIIGLLDAWFGGKGK